LLDGRVLADVHQVNTHIIHICGYIDYDTESTQPCQEMPVPLMTSASAKAFSYAN
jgi:hypothetical protein